MDVIRLKHGGKISAYLLVYQRLATVDQKFLRLKNGAPYRFRTDLSPAWQAGDHTKQSHEALINQSIEYFSILLQS